MEKDGAKALSNVIRIDDEPIRDHLKLIVQEARSSPPDSRRPLRRPSIKPLPPDNSARGIDTDSKFHQIS